MAIFVPRRSKCPICGEAINEDDDHVGTTHFIADESDPLWRFSDAVMHRRCYDAWEHRDEFTARYRKRLGGMYPGSFYETWPD
jgi:hypothetical protein